MHQQQFASQTSADTLPMVLFLEAQQLSQVEQKIQWVTDQCLKSQALSNMCFGRP
jgi:hypothetical protein